MIHRTGSKVAAVVVVFGPDDRFRKLLLSLVEQANKVWVIDNQPNYAFDKYLKGQKPCHRNNITLIENKKNVGLAAAQNQGIKLALEDGVDWVLLLDQDSILDKDFVKNMLKAGHKYKNKKNIGFLTPRHEFDDGSPSVPTYSKGLFLRPKRYHMDLDEIDDTILFGMASGSFIPRHTLEEVGLMREEFWIDYIDYEFSFRVRERGYRIIGVGGARLNHRLGVKNQLKILGKVFSFQVHPAFRRYTIYRNRIAVIKEYSMLFPEFVLFEVLSIAKDLFKLFLLEDQKFNKLRAIFIGIIHGMMGSFNRDISNQGGDE
jgi:GT2 family glycosyltransferase